MSLLLFSFLLPLLLFSVLLPLLLLSYCLWYQSLTVNVVVIIFIAFSVTVCCLCWVNKQSEVHTTFVTLLSNQNDPNLYKRVWWSRRCPQNLKEGSPTLRRWCITMRNSCRGFQEENMLCLTRPLLIEATYKENIARGTTDPGYWVQNLNYF